MDDDNELDMLTEELESMKISMQKTDSVPFRSHHMGDDNSSSKQKLRVSSKKRQNRVSSGQGGKEHSEDEGSGAVLNKQHQNLRNNYALEQNDFMAEMEEKLFGARPKKHEDLMISDKDFVPIKTGVEGYKLLKYGPKHIMNADSYEPLYIH